MSKHNPEEAGATSTSHSPEPVPDRKRKQEKIPEDDKLAIDVSAPEPPSKKARRAEKKGKSKPKTTQPTTVSDAAEASQTGTTTTGTQDASTSAPTGTRADYGIWIGNLPFSATKDSLKQFLREEGGIEGREIMRLHMPPPTDKAMAGKSSNRGFAYVDFAREEMLDKAMGLTEYMMGGRRVLIKNAKSFEGRPEKKVGGEEGVEASVVKKESSKRIFVGNLGFDVTREELEELFGAAGEVEDVFMATFQDSGKSKGFAWIRFMEAEAAEAAVRGFVYVKADEDGSGGESEDGDEDQADAGQKKTRKTKSRRHKKHINQLHGRPLRCEFAEDPQTRYKKRYGKDAVKPAPGRDRRAPPVRAAPDPAASGANREAINASASGEAPADDLSSLISAAAAARSSKGPTPHAQKRDKEQRRDERRKRHDARTVAPGAALAGAQRATGAIVEGKGRKVVFD
ncbi:Nucleolar protein 13 [Friedmanniomyces endolithicus]|nr:Nucleolar protein 13 [Friedmanniomyces endolithicus]KAK0287140.1 Nucleolar protein 13 [Friedmanniomyces endolithicus]KAK0994183.1 Nucleolar protein 13 [Friedmanniomyces endolithicus]